MASRLADGVWLLDLGLFPPLASNAYLVDDRALDQPGAGLTLVDTGLFINRPTLSSELAAAGYTPEDVDRVLITHYDIDHVGGLRAIPDDTPVHIGGEDLALVRGRHAHGINHKGLFHRAVRSLFPIDSHPIHAIAEGDEVGGFRAFHTPGHNPGHTVYVHEGLSAAFLGDLVWEQDGELTTPFWLDSYNMHELRESIRSFVDRMPPYELACMGHGDPVVGAGSEAVRALAAKL